MTVSKGKTRRPRGTGSLSARKDRAGRETWYGRFYVQGRLVKKKIGLKRSGADHEGYTHAQASAELRRLMAVTRAVPAGRERLSVQEAGDRYLAHLEAVGRKRSTLADYGSYLRVHLVPAFAGRSLESVTVEDVEAFVLARQREGKAAKSIRNWLSLLHSIFEHGQRRGWVAEGTNPVRLVDKPRQGESDDVRFLTAEELEALLGAVSADRLGSVEGPLYLTAAMTGLRQGELIGLRWRDVDWPVGRVRVRRAYVFGEFGEPKSRRGSRSVPLAEVLTRHGERILFIGALVMGLALVLRGLVQLLG